MKVWYVHRLNNLCVLTTPETRVTIWPVNSFGSPVAVAVVCSDAVVQVEANFVLSLFLSLLFLLRYMYVGFGTQAAQSGEGGTFIFSSYVGSGPASTVHPKTI